jgi:hypothetical protein
MTAGSDPWQTARDGEVWWWDGDQLIPISPDEAALVREIDAHRRLRNWKGSQLAMPARSHARSRTQRHDAFSTIIARLLTARQRLRQAPPPAPEDVVHAHR